MTKTNKKSKQNNPKNVQFSLKGHLDIYKKNSMNMLKKSIMVINMKI